VVLRDEPADIKTAVNTTVLDVTVVEMSAVVGMNGEILTHYWLEVLYVAVTF